MKLTSLALLALLVCHGTPRLEAAEELPSAPQEEDVLELEALAPGQILYNYETGVGIATNDFLIRFRGGTLTAHQGQFNQETGEVLVEGDVLLQQDNQVWRGERLQYNYLTRVLETSKFRAGRYPVFAEGEGLHLDFTNRVYAATNAYITSDDVANPGFRIRAQQLRIAPGRYFEARDAVLYVGDVPVFYFPYFRRNLGRLANTFTAVPGYRSRYGAYLLGAYHWNRSEDLGGTVHLDYRVKRGIAGGLDVAYDLHRAGTGDFKSYYAYDLGLEEVDGFDGEPVTLDKDRYRISYTHQSQPWTNLFVNVAVRYQSDPYLIRDFFESEYRDNPRPSSFLEVNRLWSDWSLSVLAQPQVNGFFETVERLPDIKLTSPRQQLGALPLFYESESSLGYLRREFGEDPVGTNYAALRADTLHQVLWPNTFLGWLNFTPRVGGRFTYYSETDSQGQELEAQERAAFHAGAELSFKASRLWPGATNRTFAIDGLRHILQPGLTYAYTPEPSALPSELPQFDRALPSLRLQPVLFPDYQMIDSIDAQNVLRLGLRNKLQTRRDGQVDNVINWDLYTDWRIDPLPGEEDFADVFSDLDLKPWRWLTLTSELRYDLEDHRLRIANHMATLTPNTVWSWSFGHRYLREDPALGFFEGHDLLLSSFYFRLNEDWGLRISHHYEMEDHTMEEQYYTLYRDFRSWTGALTFRVRDNRDGDIDYGVAFTFQLKAFPRFKSGEDRNKPSLLLGS